MLTKNGKAFLYARNCDIAVNHDTKLKMLNKENNENEINYYIHTDSSNASDYTYLVQSLMIIVGTGGSITPTIEDYDLASPITDNNLSIVSRNSRNYEIKQGNYINSPIMHATVTYQNTNSTSLGSAGNITINEVGLICWKPPYGAYGRTISIFADKDYNDTYRDAYYKPNPTTGTSYLLAREVLQTPVVIAPGETATFTITVA